MVKDFNYDTIARVIETWEEAKRVPNFENVAGTAVLLRLFDLEPRTKKVFGFDMACNPTAKEIETSGNLMHAIRMIRMFDGAFSMLGPDTDTVNSILRDLGKRHIKYGVSAHYYPFMGKALLQTLAEVLGDAWTQEVEESWVEVYDELSGEIMRTILNGSEEKMSMAGWPAIHAPKHIPERNRRRHGMKMKPDPFTRME